MADQGDYRAICEINDEVWEALAVDAGHRRDFVRPSFLFRVDTHRDWRKE